MPDTTTPSLLSSIGYLGRDLKNNTAHARTALHDLGSNSTETREFAERTLPATLASVLRDAEAIAEKLPSLRLLATGQALPTKVESLGSSIVVRYAQPTNSRGAKWLATYWRDNELTFRASHSFTYEDKDNDGADTAAGKCLAKFEEYCNGNDLDLPKVSFVLTGRTSLGNGSYAYTYKANR
jgi:hypothetical protein